MERLITDAEGLDSSFKASRDSNGNLAMSYADIVDAIHIVQDEMGITGTTSKEASETISGSIASMKAAFSNFVTGLADDNADVEQLTQDLVESVGTVVKNLAPVIGTVLKTIGKMAVDGIVSLGLKAKELIAEKINVIRDKINEKIDNIKSNIRGKVSEIKSDIVGKFNDIRTNVLEKISALRDGIRERFNAIKERIVTPIRNAKETIRGFIDDIKGFFSNLKLELPHVKLPHFRITGGEIPWGIGGKGTKPTVAIDWYAKAMRNAMILNSPTIFGMNGGTLLGGGEAGSEVVAGTGTLMAMIRNTVRSEQGNTDRLLTAILNAIIASDESLAQRIAEGVNGTKLSWSDREFKRYVEKAVG